MSHTHRLYPLTFRPELKEKVWGGRRLETAVGKDLPPDQPIGESWETHGGSIVEEGPYAGRTLDSLVEELGHKLVGTALSGLHDRPFPLLFKYIDASEFLSVQVHPDDSYAAEHLGYPYGKTEAWYVVSAEPGAQLVHGWKRQTSPAEVEAAVKENRLEELLEYVEVSSGDVVFVPAGLVHAIGGGIVLGEIQQSSDITYRLYDWGRMGLDGKPRELHVDESLRTLNYDVTERHKLASLEVGEGSATRRQLVACRYFVAELVESDSEWEIHLNGDRFELLSSLRCPVEVEWSGGKIRLDKGRTVLLPAELRRVRVACSEGFQLLRMYPPDLVHDVVQPLREAGHPDEAILALGGGRKNNDLFPVLT